MNLYGQSKAEHYEVIRMARHATKVLKAKPVKKPAKKAKTERRVPSAAN